MTQDIPGLHIGLLWLCGLAAAAVFTAMLVSIASFRHTFASQPASRTRGTATEIFWALVPIVIVIAMAAPAVMPLMSIDGAHPTVETAFRAAPPTGPEVALP